MSSRQLSGRGLMVEGDSLTLNAHYTDVGRQDFHIVEFDFGDGSLIEQEEKTPLLDGLGEASSHHVYKNEGLYTATSDNSERS